MKQKLCKGVGKELMQKLTGVSPTFKHEFITGRKLK